VIDDQDVSHDWLRRGEVAGAITAHPGPLQGCDTVPLGRLRYLATASPDYIARWLSGGIGRSAMSRAPALTFSDKDRLQADWLRLNVGPGIAFPTHRLASSQAFVDGALAGLGWGMNPLPLIADHLEAGRLVELVPGTPLDVPLHWQFARRTAPALAGLTRALQEAARGCMISDG
jgi:LysR family transcriptional regulator (chromosome initiation inhibitor)